MDSQEMLDRLPKDRKKMLDGVADACHRHIHQVGMVMGFEYLSKSALSVKDSFYDVALVPPNSLEFYATSKSFAAGSASEFKGFIILAHFDSLNDYRKLVGVAAARRIPPENQVLSLFSMEAAIRLLSEQNDLHGAEALRRQSEEAGALATEEIRCDTCGQRLRVPKYKRVNARCPKCGHEWKDLLFR